MVQVPRAATYCASVIYAYANIPLLNQIIYANAYVIIIGNCDAHLKNFSILYSPDFKSLRLSPAYDLVSTTYFERFSHRLAMSIGDAETIDNVTARSIRHMAEDIRLPIDVVKSIAEELVESMPASIETAASPIEERQDHVLYVSDRLIEDINPRINVLREFVGE